MPSPIALFAYNRPFHLQKTIESLLLNDLAKDSELFIFSDAPKIQKNKEKHTEKNIILVENVRIYLEKVQSYEGIYFKKIHIITQNQNQGLAKSIITGVTQLLDTYPHIIVLEDDMICTKDFLQFMNKCLDKYETEKQIFTISGYRFPIEIPLDFKEDVFLWQRASSWGWATWVDRWQKADWDVKNFKTFWANKTLRKAFNQGGEDLSLMLYKQQKNMISSWAVRWCFTLFEQKGFCVYPTHSKIQNIGHDNSGTNSANTTKYNIEIEEKDFILPQKPKEYPALNQKLSKFFRPSFFRKMINWIKFIGNY